MEESNVLRYEFDGPEGSANISEVHPVLNVIIGSTGSELALVLEAQKVGISDMVPHRTVVIDSLPYDDMVTRNVQRNWPREHVLNSIPRSHYFQLTNPFSEGFDFSNPLNASWLNTIFEPPLERLAGKPDAPGCAGTPALGRARVEGNQQELRVFIEGHTQQLTQVRTETLSLQVGVRVFIITTLRGGTGSGGTIPAAAVLRSALPEGSVHLHVLMPDIYGGDTRAQANAFATVRELQHMHRYDGGVPMKGGAVLPPPFDTVTMTFGSNGAVALQHGDALMQEAALLGVHLRARTQSTINSRLVDMTDVIPFTINEDPMHVRVETAVSIRGVLPGVLDYLAGEWCRQEVEAARDSFEAWCLSGDLSLSESERADELVRGAIKDVGLGRNALLARIDGSPAAANLIRAFFEQANSTLASMEAEPIKKSMSALPSQVRNLFQKLEPASLERAQVLARSLPEEVINYVTTRAAEAPHVGLAALGKISEHFSNLAKACRADAENEKKTRDAAGAQLGQALGEVQEAKGFLGLLKRNEITRDAAQQACSVAMTAALARAEQQRLELLAQVAEGEFVTTDGRGKALTIPSASSALRARQLEQMVAARRRHASQVEELGGLLDDLAQKIEKRSPVFHRALVYDQASREMLNAKASEVRKLFPEAPAVLEFLKGGQNLRQTVEALKPLLPSYADSIRTLPDIIAEDPAKRELVVRLLRNRTPFTPLDRVVEDQQGLKNRRDTLVVLEVPGGPDGPLAALMLRESIVEKVNQIVDSGEDEIRLYYMRDGLPYAAVRTLARYKERHDAYLSNPEAITPYTVADAHTYAGLEPSRVNLRMHTEEVLCVAKAVLPERVVSKPSGGFVLRYEKETGHGFATTQEKGFTDIASMVRWLAKHVTTRKALEAELAALLDADPEAYKAALVDAWQAAADKEKESLQQALFRLKVDPAKFHGEQSRLRQTGTS